MNSFWSRLASTRARLKEVALAGGCDNRVLREARPKLSVMIITYNHEAYIAQALDSVLMQERDFEIEINVIDDASPDGTQRIVREYAERHPDLINCYFNETNVGRHVTQLNTIRGFRTLRGEYFCLLEGDDYWTDPRKLAKQVAFLDANPEFVACAHWTEKVFDDGSRPPEHFLPFKQFGRTVAELDDVIRLAAVYHLSSTIYRNLFEQDPPACFADRYSCEATIHMVYASFGPFYCIEEYMSAYRVHPGGQFSVRSQDAIWRFHLHGFIRFAMYLGPSNWLSFTRATAGFSRWVLFSKARREVVARLTGRTRLLFGAALPVSTVAYGLVATSYTFVVLRNLLVTRSEDAVPQLYLSILRHAPDPLIRLVLTIEGYWPWFQTKRRRFSTKLKRVPNVGEQNV